MAVPSRVRRLARWLASGGLISVLGLYAYITIVMVTTGRAVEPIVLGRPFGWLALQAITVGTLVSALLLTVAWRQERGRVPRTEWLRLSLLLAGAALYVPWAVWWQLLSP